MRLVTQPRSARQGANTLDVRRKNRHLSDKAAHIAAHLKAVHPLPHSTLWHGNWPNWRPRTGNAWPRCLGTGKTKGNADKIAPYSEASDGQSLEGMGCFWRRAASRSAQKQNGLPETTHVNRPFAALRRSVVLHLITLAPASAASPSWTSPCAALRTTSAPNWPIGS